jgi:hypothetical protein
MATNALAAASDAAGLASSRSRTGIATLSWLLFFMARACAAATRTEGSRSCVAARSSEIDSGLTAASAKAASARNTTGDPELVSSDFNVGTASLA